MLTSSCECSSEADLDIMLTMPILRTVSSAQQGNVRENYQHEIAIATTPKMLKKVYKPMYMLTSLLASISLASDHHLSHTAVVLGILVSFIVLSGSWCTYLQIRYRISRQPY